MNKNKRDMLKEIKKNKGKICLYGGFQMVKLLGFKEDEDDYYYECQNTRGEIVWNSGVGRLMPLDKLTKSDYKEIKRIFELNCF